MAKNKKFICLNCGEYVEIKKNGMKHHKSFCKCRRPCDVKKYSDVTKKRALFVDYR